MCLCVPAQVLAAASRPLQAMDRAIFEVPGQVKAHVGQIDLLMSWAKIQFWANFCLSF
jgi:hypothetical protein